MKKQWRAWLAQLRFNKKKRQAIALCQQLYHAIPSFTLAKQARELQQQFAYEYIYGEIDFKSFAEILGRCLIKPDSVFYDLGSGAGKAVICAALLYDFKKVCGIEQLQLLHDCARQMQLHPKLAHKNIIFHQADLLTTHWLDADIIFINASAFIGDFWQQIAAQLQQLKKGTQIILISKQLPATHFTLIYSDFLPMSWGLARAQIYEVTGGLE